MRADACSFLTNTSWCHVNGRAVIYKTVDEKLKSAAATAGIPPLYTHGGRQHATIYHAWDGKSDEQVMSRLRWKTVESYKHYTARIRRFRRQLPHNETGRVKLEHLAIPASVVFPKDV